MQFLYNWFVQIGASWNNFINSQEESLQIAAQQFKGVFISVGYWWAFIIMIAVPAIIMFLYYGVYCNQPGFRYRKMHWIGFLLISFLVVGLTTYISISIVIKNSFLQTTYYLWKLTFINCLYSVILSIGYTAFISRFFRRLIKGYRLI